LLNCHPDSGWHPLSLEDLPMTVILEYGVPLTGCSRVKSWAQQWLALGGLGRGTGAFNTALQSITDQVTMRGANPRQVPNHSAIRQVRSNEFAFSTPIAESMWELRESRIPSSGASAGQLRIATIAQTPDASLQWTATLRDYINDHSAKINRGVHEVPLAWPDARSSFRGGHAQPGAGTRWNAPGILSLNARHKFSLVTCDGCHSGERVANFVHVGTRLFGATSPLSDFLTGAGMPKSDPVSGVNRTFNELLRRSQLLDATASMICRKDFGFPLSELFFAPLPPAFAH
jgi:hypothetical protein